MVTYSFILTFEPEFQEKLYTYAESLNKEIDTSYKLERDTIPHITVVKFESEKELSSDQVSKLRSLLPIDIKVTLGGLTLLPSHSGGTWIEISVYNSIVLGSVQKRILEALEGMDVEIKSGTNNNFRPHITLSKAKEKNNLNIKELDENIVRTEGTKVELVFGYYKGIELKLLN